MEVTIRDATAEDLPILFEHQADPEAARMAVFGSRPWDAFVRHWTRIMADPDMTTKAVLADGEVVGNVGLWDGPTGRLVGYWIGREHWGRGIATRALALALEEEPTRPIWAHVATSNVGSRRVLEKCGFRVVSQTVDGEVEELLMRFDGEPST